MVEIKTSNLKNVHFRLSYAFDLRLNRCTLYQCCFTFFKLVIFAHLYGRIFSRFDAMLERDRQTPSQPDRHRTTGQAARLCIALRSKNCQ